MKLFVKFFLSIVFYLGLFLTFNSCEQKHKNPISPDTGEFPPAPKHLVAWVEDGAVILTWEIADTSSIRKYNVFRKDSLQGQMRLIDSSFVRRYQDAGLHNGRQYFYQIAAVNVRGYEGAKSNTVSAIPNVFSVTIENGKEFTNTTSVSLSLTAPSGTTLMRISNDSTFADASWESFAPYKSWTLTSGDGEKTVYAKFRDGDGNETLSPSRDKIILDTKATISEVTEDTNGQTKSAGDVIHFVVKSGEPYGTATIDVGSARQGIKLYDDGTNGDSVREDGTYEVDYQIPRGIEVTDATITGHFTDRAGNIAPAVTATGKVTIQQPPSAVTLFPPTTIGSSATSLNISWSKNTDSDFASYKLYRSKTSGVSSASTLVATIASQSTTTFDDTDLQENTTYYYRIYVYDTSGLSSGSNEVNGTTGANEPPTSVTLFTPSNATESSLSLAWTQSNESDFASYRLFRSETPGVSTTSTLAATITTQNEVTYTDHNLKENTTYYYRVYVYDTAGLSAGSNEVSGTTAINESPTAVTLFVPSEATQSSLYISWTQNNDSDFSSYRLFRSKSSGVTTSSQFVTIIIDRTVTYFRDTGLEENTTYYYRLYVYDNGGESTGSNEVSATTTTNEPPTAVTLAIPSVVDSVTLRLSWSQNSDDDFASYRVFRSESSPVDTSVGPVAIINSRSTTEYVDVGLTTGTRYYYKVFVFDQGGLSTGSNEVSGTPR